MGTHVNVDGGTLFTFVALWLTRATIIVMPQGASVDTDAPIVSGKSGGLAGKSSFEVLL